MKRRLAALAEWAVGLAAIALLLWLPLLNDEPLVMFTLVTLQP